MKVETDIISNDIKHMMIIPIKMITSDFKVLTYIITSIPACSYWTPLVFSGVHSSCYSICTVKPVLGGHSWGMSKVTSQER
jgi:hypothetical protein